MLDYHKKMVEMEDEQCTKESLEDINNKTIAKANTKM